MVAGSANKLSILFVFTMGLKIICDFFPEMLKITGYILFGICCVSFLSIPVLPWLGFSGGKIAKITVIMIIAGEITFYLSIFILGKSIIEKIKNIFKFWKKK